MGMNEDPLRATFWAKQSILAVSRFMVLLRGRCSSIISQINVFTSISATAVFLLRARPVPLVLSSVLFLALYSPTNLVEGDANCKTSQLIATGKEKLVGAKQRLDDKSSCCQTTENGEEKKGCCPSPSSRGSGLGILSELLRTCTYSGRRRRETSVS